ncbi:FMN-binding protein, partial [bacterium]|nr:FMN-binding protein [bacterium]
KTRTQFYAGRGLKDTDWRVKKDGGDLDAVTGATVTGRALAGAISAALTQYAEDQPQLAAAPRAAAADTSQVEVMP